MFITFKLLYGEGKKRKISTSYIYIYIYIWVRRNYFPCFYYIGIPTRHVHNSPGMRYIRDMAGIYDCKGIHF